MFNRATGMSYVRFFRRLHAAHLFDWYLEIGCRDGRILEMARGKSIGVDPVFRLDRPLLGRKPQLHLFQETSDAFFAARRLDALGARPSVTFVDGMHLFEFALRDIAHAEAASDPSGVIYAHDCFPFTHEMTTRDLDRLPPVWAGDVWKLVPILLEYRPRLRLTALDASPTGLLALTGLDPADTTLFDAMDEIVDRYTDVTLESFGVERFYGLLPWVSAAETAKDDMPALAPLARPDLALSEPEVVTP